MERALTVCGGDSVVRVDAEARLITFPVGTAGLEISLEAPTVLLRAGESAWRAILEFFTASLENDHTRSNYARDLSRFFRWVDEQGVTELAQVDTVLCAAYRDALWTYDRPDYMRKRDTADEVSKRSAPTLKRNLSAISGLFDFLTEKGVTRANPMASVKRPKHSRTVGKTPHVEADDAVLILDSIDPSTPVGLRDRAYVVTLGLCWGRVSEVLGMNLRDYFPSGKRWNFRLLQKGSKEQEIPAHETAELYLDAWLDHLATERGYASRDELLVAEAHMPLFRAFDRPTGRFSDRRVNRNQALRMIKRRAKKAGLPNWASLNNHTWRASGVTNYLNNGGSLEYAQTQCGHADIRTTRLYDHRQRETSRDEVARVRLFARDPIAPDDSTADQDNERTGRDSASNDMPR